MAHAELCIHAARVAVQCLHVALRSVQTELLVVRALTQDIDACIDAVHTVGNAVNICALQSVLTTARKTLFRIHNSKPVLQAAYTAVRAAHVTCTTLYAQHGADTPIAMRACLYVFKLTPACVEAAHTCMDAAASAFVDGCSAQAATMFMVAVLAAMWQDPSAHTQLSHSTDSYTLRERAQSALLRCPTHDGVPSVSHTTARTRAVLSVLHALNLDCCEAAFMASTTRATQCAVLAWRAVHGASASAWSERFSLHVQ